MQKSTRGETLKATLRRLSDNRFATRYFRGEGIDIGSGADPLSDNSHPFPLISSIRNWDLQDGDAQTMQSVAAETYDFVHTSHCLEHMRDPYEAFANWIRICRRGGYIITTVPDEDLFEQGQWPSTWNGDHKTTWTILKDSSWSPVSINVIEFLYQFKSEIQVIKIDLADYTYQYGLERQDQTWSGITESAIEFVVKRL
jgi:SAM-dependent methyltransferase